MSLSIEIPKKLQATQNRKITKISEVFELEEVQQKKNMTKSIFLIIDYKII